jgi:hypothetical protein
MFTAFKSINITDKGIVYKQETMAYWNVGKALSILDLSTGHTSRCTSRATAGTRQEMAGTRGSSIWNKQLMYCVRFEVSTAVTMKNGVFWVVTPCDFFAAYVGC